MFLAPAAVEDCLCALHWVGRNAKKYNFDLSKVVVTGGSAGGHLALTTSMIPFSAGFENECAYEDDETWAGSWKDAKPKVAAVINWFGITDVSDMLQGPNIRAYAVSWLGNPPNREDLAKRLSPLSYVRPGLPPILTIHGDADTIGGREEPIAHHTRRRTRGLHGRARVAGFRSHPHIPGDDGNLPSRQVAALPATPAGPYVLVTLSTAVEELEEVKLDTYIERCRKKIPSFVNDNFSLEQTWNLQRPTLWFDLACAPINSAWALPHLAIHKAAEAAERVGYPQPARWAKYLPPGIKTGYQRQIEQRICRDLLEWDRDSSDRAPARTLLDLLHQFSSGRAIVSDIFGTLLTLAMSWTIMGSTSLSLMNIAHGIARKGAHDRAASRFFLGKKVGSAFYNVFPPAVHESTIWTILLFLGAGLAIGGMAGTILSDPIRKFLGFHRHRLEVLLDEIEREMIVISHKKIRQKPQS